MRALDLRPTGGGGGEWGGARLGPTADGGVGDARDSNTPRTYARRGGGGGVRAIVTHPGPTADGGARDRNTPQTYDRRGCLKKEDKYTSGLMLRRTPDRALKNRTVRPKAGRMATLVTSPANLKTCTAL